MKVIVGHPFKQHSFQLATALEKRGMLYKYCTTVYDKKGTIVFWAKNILKKDTLKKANGRKCTGFSDDKVKVMGELFGLSVLLINRLTFIPNFVRVFQRALFKVFGKKIAEYALKEEPDVLVMYDTTATKCFETIRKKNDKIKLVLDMSTCTRAYARTIYDIDMKLTGSNQFKRVQGYLWKPNTISYLQRELEMADYFIVASEFAKRSLVECGIDSRKIFKVPYGVDQGNFRCDLQKFEDRKDKPLEMIFVGQVDYRKGIMHLLKALGTFDETKINLKLVGEIDKKSEIFQIARNMANVKFTGFVTKDKLADLYNASDVFIFPTLCEGFGLVVLEAMSCGVPVICSTNAGGNDVITEGENGFEIPASNVEIIKEKIQWCLDNREKLFLMRENAKRTAEYYTWERYYNGIANVFEQIEELNE